MILKICARWDIPGSALGSAPEGALRNRGVLRGPPESAPQRAQKFAMLKLASA